MIGPSTLEGLGINVIAQLAELGATLCYAFAAIFGRRFKDVPPMVVAAGQLTATTLMVLPIAMVIDKPWTLFPIHLVTWGSVVALALLCTAVAYILYFKILATSGAANLLLVTFLIPVSALLLGMTILGERLDPRHFMGIALIGVGLATMDGRPLRLLRRSSPCRAASERMTSDHCRGLDS